MILSTEHKFIFFSNGKTGTTSIERALSKYDESENYRFASKGLFNKIHIPPVLVKAMVPETLWKECFKFTFVRNPYDWFVSQWFYNFAARPEASDSALKQLEQRTRIVSKRISNWKRVRRYEPSLQPSTDLARRECFSRNDILFLYDFLRAKDRTLPIYEGKYQVSYIWDADRRTIVDFIGRFERLSSDFNLAMERIGLNVSLPEANRTDHRYYQTYFNEDAAQYVYDLWRLDFDALNYPRDLPPIKIHARGQ